MIKITNQVDVSMLLDMLPIGIVITDRDGVITYANANLEKLVGYPKEEILGKKPSLWKSNNHTIGFYKQMWDKLLSGGIWDGAIQNRRRDGSVFWAGLWIKPIFSGQELIGFLATMRDISYEYHQQQQILDYYEKLYLDVFDSVRVGIGIIGQDRSLIYVNHQLRRWLGEKAGVEEYMMALSEWPFVSACIDRVFSSGQCQVITVDLKNVVYKVQVFPMRQEEGTDGVVLVVMDITQEKMNEKEMQLYREYLEQEIENRTHALLRTKRQLEQQTIDLKEAHENLKILYEELKQKNEFLREMDRLKTEFLYMVSHELRTPLTTIREGVSLVLDKVFGEITAEQEDMLRTVLSDVDRLTRIVNHFLDLAKIEAGRLVLEKRRIGAKELVNSVVKSFRPLCEEKGLDLICDCDVDGLQVYCDVDRIIQVLSNLLGNAIKFTDAGYIKVEVREQSENVFFCVEDTGIGVPDSDKELIFDKFCQVNRSSKVGGTGLGLPISQGLVELHNGRMWVEDRKGGGSRFCFVLPKEIKECEIKEER